MVEPSSEPYAKESEQLVVEYIEKGMLSESVEKRATAYLADDNPVQALEKILEHQ